MIDQVLIDYKNPIDILGENGLLKQLTKAVLERALQAEMAVHLGHGKHGPVSNATGNSRNGTCQKTLKDDFGSLPVDIPRDDRQGQFEPQIIEKHQTRREGFDEKYDTVNAKYDTPHILDHQLR